MPIDYSKWDHLDEYDDDDDGDESVDGGPTPQVTRLDGPSTVTFGGGGTTSIAPSSVSIGPSSPSAVPPAHEGEKKLFSSQTTTTNRTLGVKQSIGDGDNDEGNRLQSIPPEHLEQYHESWTERGGLVTVPATEELSPSSPDDNSTSRNRRRLYWSQDRYSIYFRLELHPFETIQSVEVVGVTQYIDRFSATGSTKPRLVCRGTTTRGMDTDDDVVTTNQNKQQQSPTVLLLEGDLPHPVHLAEDDDDIDWSIVRADSTTTTGRYLFITLYKAVPMQGVFIWWRRPLMNLPELLQVDGTTSSSSLTNNNQNETFLKAWDEAHRMFRDKKQTPHVI